MASKIYTANELREAAVSPTYVGGVFEVRVKPEVYEMLEQAADMVEENAKLRECLGEACGLQLRCDSCKIRKCDSICTLKLKWRKALEGEN